jgi:extradiol dioxygenase family protein
MSIFHLAVPVNDLSETKKFYQQFFGVEVGREYDRYVIFNFLGHQLVCHRDPENVPKTVSMYPRHYGIIFEDKNIFDQVYQRCKENNAPFFEELFERFINEPGWHYSFFVQDPANNLLEFKYYVNQSDIFA